MALTPEEKADRKRQRMIETAEQYQLGTYIRKYVAPVYQKMIRAEYGASRELTVLAMVDGELLPVERDLGQCVCVTCGIRRAWDSGLGGMHAGHFLASRRQSILFEEDNIAPQCSGCNRYRGGEPQLYRIWMAEVRGHGTIERLEQLKTESVTFSRDELVDMRIGYQVRLDAAIERMRAQ